VMIVADFSLAFVVVDPATAMEVEMMVVGPATVMEVDSATAVEIEMMVVGPATVMVVDPATAMEVEMMVVGPATVMEVVMMVADLVTLVVLLIIGSMVVAMMVVMVAVVTMAVVTMATVTAVVVMMVVMTVVGTTVVATHPGIGVDNISNTTVHCTILQYNLPWEQVWVPHCWMLNKGLVQNFWNGLYHNHQWMAHMLIQMKTRLTYLQCLHVIVGIFQTTLNKLVKCYAESVGFLMQ